MTEPRFEPHRAVVLDVEGTTTSISFVYDVLFPFARQALGRTLRDRWDDAEVQGAVATLWAEADAPDDAPTAESAERFALRLMDEDRKATGLKQLQGLVWRQGYASGALRGHVFEDVPRALEVWAARGVRAFIYSSGSVEAQRLLFGHSEAGDLTPLLQGHFDTTTGPKKEAASYRAIAAAIDEEPGAILFLTDSLDEARAAREAGLQVGLSVRPGNPPAGAHDFTVVERFDTLADRV